MYAISVAPEVGDNIMEYGSISEQFGLNLISTYVSDNENSCVNC